MAVGANAITTLEKAKRYLRIDARDPAYQTDALDIYYDDNAGAGTAATVEVRENDLVLTVTGDAGSTATLDLTAAANDTLSELVGVINGTGSWVCQALTYGDVETDTMIETAALDAFGQAKRKTLQITDDRMLELIIDGVTAEIEAFLGRGIASRNYSEEYLWNPGLERSFSLRQPDVTGVTRLSLNSKAAFTAVYAGTDEHATLEVTATTAVLRSQTATGTTSSTTSTFTTDTDVTAVVATLNAAAGWTVTLVADGPSDLLVRQGAVDATVTATAYSWDDVGELYTVDYEAGTIWLTSLRWPYALRWYEPRIWRLRIEYTAGYATVPADVEMVAWQMIAAEWLAASSDPGITSESLDAYSYTNTQLATHAQGEEWQTRLARYRRWLP